MSDKNPKVDAYIAKQADFARPILSRFRELVHETCPAVQETIKWGKPSFEYNGILCGMAAMPPASKSNSCSATANNSPG